MVCTSEHDVEKSDARLGGARTDCNINNSGHMPEGLQRAPGMAHPDVVQAGISWDHKCAICKGHMEPTLMSSTASTSVLRA